jgi:hypothetical protein
VLPLTGSGAAGDPVGPKHAVYGLHRRPIPA